MSPGTTHSKYSKGKVGKLVEMDDAMVCNEIIKFKN
jgi:hypothetical protein